MAEESLPRIIEAAPGLTIEVTAGGLAVWHAGEVVSPGPCVWEETRGKTIAPEPGPQNEA